MPEPRSSAEHVLVDFVQRLARNPFGWRAVVLHLSRLRSEHRGAPQMCIATNTFELLVKRFEGQIFPLADGDLVLLCKGANATDIDEAVQSVRYLFGDDPLAADFDGDTGNGFASWYELGADCAPFVAFAEEAAQRAARRQQRLATPGAGASAAKRTPLDPAALAQLIKTISRADLSNLLRRQAVCAIADDDAPKPIYREVYISVAELRDAVMPRHDIASDPWLFKYLTQTLDRRVLALMRRKDDGLPDHGYGLNLNVSTLLSPEFLAFDGNVHSGARGSIVIEIGKLDVYADIGAFIFARDFARERSYRLCLDGVTALTLPFVDRRRLGVDLVKLFWAPEMASGEASERHRELVAALERIGRTRVILARCDTSEAVAFGQAQGIRLFQGRYVDRLLSRRPHRPPARNVRRADPDSLASPPHYP
jgi:EAL domain-containing protein (putative c-di-GMP-specific phosphodiesterase class I)